MRIMTETSIDFASAREAMINSQLRTSGVNAGWVLARMRDVPRETFVPASARVAAYGDRAVRLEDERFLAAPVFYGMLLQEARPVSSDRVLIVSCAPDYLAELVRPLVAELRTLTPDEALRPPESPDDATLLLIDGAAEEVPSTLVARLAPNGRAAGGIIRSGVQRLATGRVVGDELVWQAVIEMGIPRLTAFDAPKSWRF